MLCDKWFLYVNGTQKFKKYFEEIRKLIQSANNSNIPSKVAFAQKLQTLTRLQLIENKIDWQFAVRYFALPAICLTKVYLAIVASRRV